jgi:hypothetical protein
VRRVLSISLLALVVAAPAAAFDRAITRQKDLDGNGDRETIRVRAFRAPDDTGDFARTQVRVADDCPRGRIDRRIAPIHDDLELMRIRHADTRRGKEVFLVLRDGARSVLGEVRLVAWRRAQGQPCRHPRPVFVYDTGRHTATPPGGTGDIAAFFTSLRNITNRFRGREVAIDERFLAEGDPPSFGSIKKVTYWRYARKRDRYVRYSTMVRRLSNPG